MVDPDPDPADGTGGASPMLCISGVAGLGIKIVLRTSRRPRSVDDLLGGAACCSVLDLRLRNSLVIPYRAQSVDHVRHCGVGVSLFLLNGSISNVKLELRRRVAIGLSTARLSVCYQVHFLVVLTIQPHAQLP